MGLSYTVLEQNSIGQLWSGRGVKCTCQQYLIRCICAKDTLQLPYTCRWNDFPPVTVLGTAVSVWICRMSTQGPRLCVPCTCKLRRWRIFIALCYFSLTKRPTQTSKLETIRWLWWVTNIPTSMQTLNVIVGRTPVVARLMFVIVTHLQFMGILKCASISG